MKNKEVLTILKWVKSTQNISDESLSQLLDISRPTLSKIRSDKYPDYTGDSLLPMVRKLAAKYGMSGYEKHPPQKPTLIATRVSSLPRSTMTIARGTQARVTTTPPVQQKPSQDVSRAKQHTPVQTYRIGESFLCGNCHLGVTAHDDGREKQCPHCHHPYQTSLDYARDHRIVSPYQTPPKKDPKHIRVIRLK